jgi:hemerythrin-like domain-containing protein
VHQWHHGKEEEILFPLLEKKGIPADGGPLGVMLMEHGRARALINDRYSFQRH